MKLNQVVIVAGNDDDKTAVAALKKKAKTSQAGTKTKAGKHKSHGAGCSNDAAELQPADVGNQDSPCPHDSPGDEQDDNTDADEAKEYGNNVSPQLVVNINVAESALDGYNLGDLEQFMAFDAAAPAVALDDANDIAAADDDDDGVDDTAYDGGGKVGKDQCRKAPARQKQVCLACLLSLTNNRGALNAHWSV